MEQFEKYYQIIEKYKEKNPEISKIIEDLLNKNIKNLEEISEIKKNLGFFRHEIGNPLNAVTGFSEYLLNHTDDPKQVREFSKYIRENIEIVNSLTNILGPNVLEMKEEFIPEEWTTNLCNSYEKEMIKQKIGLNLRYQEDNHLPIKVKGSKAVYEIPVKTLLENSLLWAREYSKIGVGIRISRRGNLETLIENKVGETRREINFGEGKGIGQERVRSWVEQIGGEFQTYYKPQIIEKYQKNIYGRTEHFGNIRATDHIQEGDKIYGIKLKIPVEKLDNKNI